eukprot:s992_g19.t1
MKKRSTEKMPGKPDLWLGSRRCKPTTPPEQSGSEAASRAACPRSCTPDRSVCSHQTGQRWQAVCEQARNTSQLSFADKLQILKDVSPQRRDDMQRRTEVQFFNAAQDFKKCSAAGPDQWTAAEVRMLPLCALAAFWKLTGRCEKTGKVPASLCELRQVNVPKTAKIRAGNCLDVNICVL